MELQEFWKLNRPKGALAKQTKPVVKPYIKANLGPYNNPHIIDIIDIVSNVICGTNFEKIVVQYPRKIPIGNKIIFKAVSPKTKRKIKDVTHIMASATVGSS